MDKIAMKFLSKRLSLLIAALLAFTMSAPVLPAAAQEIAPEHLAIARKYVDLTDKSGIFATMLLTTAVDTMKTIISLNPELVEPTDKAITKTLDSYRGKTGDLLDQLARVYALNFSPEELQLIVDFYSSPVGQKLAIANATLNKSVQEVVGVFDANLRREFYAKVRAELKAAGFNV